jgi:hypothetical protein
VRKTGLLLVLLLCLVTINPVRGFAQMMAANDTPEMPTAAAVETPVMRAEIKPPHKFFDRQNISLSVMTFSAALSDGITTQHALGMHRTFATTYNGVTTTTQVKYVERNPIAAPLVNRGWSGQIAATALTAGGDLALRGWLHRKGHHRVERILPYMFAATSASFALHNAHYW